ncbi:MAG TPA: DUF934 domain-containing protein, partial [Xanthobacteraceae bacterium]|nr:DUF934 domain-containing protein [Xanthobacteraceae bacterium]
FHFLARAGFDSFEVKKPADARVFAEVVARFSAYYQPGADGRPVARQRRVKAAKIDQVARLEQSESRERSTS